MRKSGILLHISSLPGPYGIGTFGKSAYEFVDFLKKAGQKYWQVLPLGHTSYGDSPYQTFSAFAGNPYFIDLNILKEEGLLEDKDIESYNYNDDNVQYDYIYNTRFIILKKAFNNFNITNNNSFNSFINENDDWLDNYAVFMALKVKHKGKSWHNFDNKYIRKNRNNLESFINDNKNEILFWKFLQYEFFSQWMLLKKYANNNGIEIIGDMPIYVAFDSADVWGDPSNFQLNECLNPIVVAGCPPDYFSKTGQLWGNPIYDYEKMEKDNFSWWIKRIKKSFLMYDRVRIDHFRGFESYYAIPFCDKTAENGKWIKGPDYKLFKTIEDEMGKLDIIAEDLGYLTEDVYKLLEKTSFPGMKVLQFSFSSDKDNPHLPTNYKRNLVCYTGTHDNMTLKEFYNTVNTDEKKMMMCYGISFKNEEQDIDDLINLSLNSISDTCIIPIVDYLHLGKEARFNTPSKSFGNWKFRLKKEMLSESIANKILSMTVKSGRR